MSSWDKSLSQGYKSPLDRGWYSKKAFSDTIHNNLQLTTSEVTAEIEVVLEVVVVILVSEYRNGVFSLWPVTTT